MSKLFNQSNCYKCQRDRSFGQAAAPRNSSHLRSWGSVPPHRPTPRLPSLGDTVLEMLGEDRALSYSLSDAGAAQLACKKLVHKILRYVSILG